MNKLIKNQRHLCDWVKKQEGALDIAVAFWGVGALEELGLNQPERNIRVLLDLSAGATNPSVVNSLIETYPGMIRSVDRLHAKAFIGQHEVALGSANASANGLGLEGSEATQWRELGIISDDASVVDEARAWFAQLWTLAKPIEAKSEALIEAERAWSLRRVNRPLPNVASHSLIAAALADPDAFMDRRWYVVVDVEDMDPEGIAALVKKTEETGRPAFAWQHWPDIPKHAHLISFMEDENGKFTFSNEEHANEPVYFSGEENNGPMQFVEATSIPGFKNNLGDIRQWRKLLKRAKKDAGGWSDESGLCMDLATFVRMYGETAS